MYGVDCLPKHVAEQNNEVPGPARWVKRLSPPPRFLLVVLLSVQILFLAIVRLGPSASIWGSSMASPPQTLSYTASFFVGSKAATNEELHTEEKDALSATRVVTTFADDDSSSRVESSSSSTLSASSTNKKKGPLKKKLSSKQKLVLKKTRKSKRDSSSVHSLKQQESPDKAVNAVTQKVDQNRRAVVDLVDDLLPSIDDKLLADPASKGASSSSSEAKVDGSGARSSLKQQESPDKAVNAVTQKVDQNGRAVVDLIDDLLPSIDDKLLADPASKGASSSSLEAKVVGSGARSSSSDPLLPTLDKQSGQEETALLLGELPVKVHTEIAKSVNKDDHVENHEEGALEEAKVLEPLGEFSAETLGEEGVKISSKIEDQSKEIQKEDIFTVKEDITQEEAITAQPGGEFLAEVLDRRVTKSGKDEHLEGVESDVVTEKTESEQEQALSAEKVSKTSKVDVGQKEEQAKEAINGPQKNDSEKVDDHSLELPLNEPSVQDENGTSSHCNYGYIYVYDLPPTFNRDIISNCSALNPWLDVCSTLLNGGLGESLGEASPLGQVGSWFISDQFTAEIVYHNRMLQHPCLTDKVEHVSGFYVPFYAGLDVGRFLWSGASAELRDRVSEQLLQWLAEQPAWKASMGGWNHFMTVGRITWDFRRSKDEDWGSGFFYKPAMQNMTRLLIERNPWDGQEMGVPYLTNFHPQSDSDMVAWQNHIRGMKRNVLFSFAGAPRKRFSNDFRGVLFEQCTQAQSCRFVDCSNRTCSDNQKTMELFLDSIFCLQPRGDSFTRRSTFDCLLAGSIPVFFWHRSAYMQYKWHLPVDEASYSIFILRDEVRNGTKIEDILKALPPEKVQAMQEAVVRLVPRIVYAASDFSLKEEKDAFDVAIEGVMKKFKGPSLRVER